MPDQPLSPNPAPEVHALRADWAAAPDKSPERRHATAALQALAEAGDATPELTDQEIPPLPDYLKNRWEEAYGSRSAASPVSANTEKSFFTALRGWWSGSQGMAWAGVAVALIAVVLVVNQGKDPLAPTTGVITRGTTTPDAETAAPIFVITSGQDASAILTQLRAAFPARTITAVPGRAEVPAGPAVVLEADAALLENPDNAVSAVETADEAAAEARQ
jgi:hypothetical protein